ncbi:MAG: sigma-70 family RNA polymerase sigma factor [Burkholderiaceae bacterium]
MDFAAHAHVAAAVTAQEAASHRDYLYRFAMQKVGDADLADDLVQETLLAALQSAQRASSGASSNFEGRSTYRVWLTGILKHKIMDAWRERGRTVSLASESEEGDDSLMEAAINEHADHATVQRHDPHAQYAWQQLAHRVQVAADELPAGVAEVFVAREIEGESTESLCQRLGLTEQNVGIRVHRARKAMKKALMAEGFGAVAMA